MKKARFNSDRNCFHCLFYRGIQKAMDGVTPIYGQCLADGTKDIIKFHGVTCENFKQDPTNPIPRYKPTEEEKEASSLLRRRHSFRSKYPLSATRKKEYPNPGIKTPLIRSKRKQAIQAGILSDNIEVRKLLDSLFKLSKRSKGEGRKIRRQLRKLGFYLSKKGGKKE